MVGAKVPILEIEKLRISKNGRGILVYERDRLHRDWAGCNFSGSTSEGKQFLYAPSSEGWLKVHVVSGSTYGPTGASYYIPLFKSLNTYI